MALKTRNRNHRSARLKSVAAALALAVLLDGCSFAPFFAPTPTPTEDPVVVTPAPTPEPIPTSGPTPRP